MLTSYRRLLGVPRLPSLLFWSLLARLHIAGLPIAVTFLVAGWTDSYALAGLVSGALTVGTALAGPVRGRMADRGSTDRLMAGSGLGYAAGLAALALLPAALWWAAIPLALVTGLLLPPAGQIGRALWPRITTGPARQAVYASEATLQELLFVVGPLLAAGAVGVIGGRGAVVLLAAVSLTGALGFAVALRRAGLTGVAGIGGAQGGPRRSLLGHPPLALVIGLCLLLVGGLGAVDLVIVAWARELGAPGYAGGLAAIWALGSLVGGLVAGGLPGAPHIPRRAFGAAAGTALLVPLLPPVLHLPSPWLISPVLFASGLAIAPTLAAVMDRLGELAPEHRRAEAFGWLSTATTTGISFAAPLTGWLIDLGGVAAGVAGAALLALGAALLSLFVRPGPSAGR
ncbi:MFS family permease [Spinactinospora alkalitolerans]|uniref:MFS family permease n=1 Tax=Spinactinospora alkalitolerans TaxID=687207 RepID=A0A852TW55_9ACTN|nr:MFS transporter [Spinactinospora alkalitolerans]NYE46304.1 MFS family permease [Spinactinospora alkalitolerans]